MKKLMILTAALAGFGAQAWAAPIGTVQSANRSQIVRQNDVVAIDGSLPAVLSTADRIQTSTAPARLNLTNGDIVVLQEKSSAGMIDASNVDFQQGRLVASLKPGSVTAVHFGALVIKSVSGVASHGVAIIGVESSSVSKLTVANFGVEPLAITDSKTGKQVAILSKGDTMAITRTLATDGEPATYAATSATPLALQQQAPTDPTADPAVEEDQDSRKKAVPFWWVAGAVVGAGAVGYGGYLLVDSLTNNNGGGGGGNNGNNNRRAASPVLFVPEPVLDGH
ncbi:hypothetical protein BH09SUM1_BH09SUM1_15900 [soil metagenome]